MKKICILGMLSSLSLISSTPSYQPDYVILFAGVQISGRGSSNLLVPKSLNNFKCDQLNDDAQACRRRVLSDAEKTTTLKIQIMQDVLPAIIQDASEKDVRLIGLNSMLQHTGQQLVSRAHFLRSIYEN